MISMSLVELEGGEDHEDDLKNEQRARELLLSDMVNRRVCACASKSSLTKSSLGMTVGHTERCLTATRCSNVSTTS